MAELDNLPPPPPPYEVNQREFDQKTSQAVEASLSLSDGRNQAGSSREADDWEYDEAAFEAAFQAAVRLRESEGGGSSTVIGQLSPSHHRSQSYEKSGRTTSPEIDTKSAEPKLKERPSWYADANFGDVSSQSSSSSFRPPRSLAATPQPSSPYPPPSHEDHEAPPPFQAKQTYPSNESAPPSPLGSPPFPPHAPLQSLHADARGRALSWAPQAHPHSFSPPPRRAPHRMGPRANIPVPPVTHGSQGRLNFDPSVAYTKPRLGSAPPSIEAQSLDPAAFYNSAVSSHMPAAYSKPSSRVSQAYPRQPQYHNPQSIPQTNPNFPPNLAALPTAAPSFAPYNPYPGYPPAPQMAVPHGVMQPSTYNPYSAQNYSVPQGYATQSYIPQSYAPQSFPAQPTRWATSEDQLSREFR